MPSRVNFFLIIIFSVAVAICAIFFYTTTNDQVNSPVEDSGIFEEVFQCPDVFLRNYALMEKGFKIFMYPNKDADAFFFNDEHIHRGFSTEVFFSRRLMFSERFITNDPTQAHMFFIPITWLQLEGTGIFANADDYVGRIINEYPHWNRSKGVDHFLVTCCYAGAMFTESVPLNNSIRLSCSARNDDLHHKHHLISIPR
ncbi:probable glycosyltransferase At5g03795 [Tripterygium wilfordii]|uniref:probable glycosyltransferase At5g03795 n=1 Tax=Tripterygium wilfordii TaxID=458696 RepID=UPI0018F7FB47|nr:probable glycosyltransferase At5g03795 [Tripterygium wilfordii]